MVRLPGGAGTTGKKQVSIGGDAGVPVGQFGLIGAMYGRREGGREVWGGARVSILIQHSHPHVFCATRAFITAVNLRVLVFLVFLVFLVSGGS